MMRDVRRRTLLEENTADSAPEDQPKPNYCPLPPRGESSDLNEAELLIIRYRKLIADLRAVRGKLYRLGIDPEKY